MFNHCGGHVPATVRAHETLHWRAEIVGELGGLEAAKTPPTVGHRVAGASGEEDRPLLGLEHFGPENATASEAGQAGGRHRAARSPPPPRARPHVWPAELAHPASGRARGLRSVTISMTLAPRPHVWPAELAHPASGRARGLRSVTISMTLARLRASGGTRALPSCSVRSLLASRAAHRVGYVANRRRLAAPRDPRTLGRRSRSLHVDALVGAPRSYRGNGWLADPLDANAGVLPACCRVRLADDFPLPGLVYEAVTDPKLHRQDAACGGRGWLGLLLGS